MYPTFRDGAILRGRHNCKYRSDADLVAVTPHGESYFLTPELFQTFLLCDGLTPSANIPRFDNYINEIPDCLDIISLSETSSSRVPQQVVETHNLVAPCRQAIWHLTRQCNMKCSHCYYLADDGIPKKQMFSDQEILATACHLSALGIESVRLSGGEASLNRHQFELVVDTITRKYCIPMILNTNGWKWRDFTVTALQNNPFVRGIQISLDGTTLSHDTLRGVKSHKEVVSNISRYLETGIHVRIISMLTDKWLTKDGVAKVCELIANLGVKDWVVEVPSVTGRWLETETKRVQDIAGAAKEFYDFLTHKKHCVEHFSFTQMFNWPMSQTREPKTLQDPVCSHDLGLLTFGPEGVSYCTLFQKQFGDAMSNLGHLHTEKFVDIWNTIALARLTHKISDNRSCKECNLFTICQGGCPGQYENATNFQGCDPHSRNLALAKQSFFQLIGTPIS
ncbi:radical SAM protein [Patescibacteria group bacterium]|nr:radical SAM protein [Patescibacteria group bacterium]MBU1895733.1 radical SAM protein [Patescibacteria group bacterium]